MPVNRCFGPHSRAETGQRRVATAVRLPLTDAATESSLAARVNARLIASALIASPSTRCCYKATPACDCYTRSGPGWLLGWSHLSYNLHARRHLFGPESPVTTPTMTPLSCAGAASSAVSYNRSGSAPARRGSALARAVTTSPCSTVYRRRTARPATRQDHCIRKEGCSTSPRPGPSWGFTSDPLPRGGVGFAGPASRPCDRYRRT